MKLSTQTHFSQGWHTRLLTDIAGLGANTIRDGLSWNAVEGRKGVYQFNDNSVAWLQKALNAGFNVVLVFNPANALYDGGYSVHTAAGRAAFADFVVATLKAYPGIKSIEIGNEYNTNDFVDGPIAGAPKDERDEYYTKLVSAVDAALDKAGLDPEVIGGSTHSVPVDYFADLAAGGALAHVDSISVHPYSSEPEQFAAQLELLREVVGQKVAIHVTEFGDKFENLAEAPAFLAKMVAVMADAGVASANWYAFARQSFFPNMELWDPGSDKATPAGVTFKLLEDMLAGDAAVARVAAGSHTYLYSFGGDSAILWGEPRGVTLGAGVTAYDLAGRKITSLSQLSPDTPVILRSASGDIASKVSFADTPLLADSFHDFDVNSADGFDGPWSYFAENGLGKATALGTMGGGHTAGEPWNPYLGLASLRPFQISATNLTPVDFSPKKDRDFTEYATVERFTAQADGKVVIRGHWDVSQLTTDGVELRIEVNDRLIYSKVIFNKANGHVLDLELTDIVLKAGDKVDFEIGTNGTARGDVTERRIQILDQDKLEELGFEVDPNPPPVDPVDPVDPPAGDKPMKLKGKFTDDVLLGGSKNDSISGLGGDDTLTGGDGEDSLEGGAGRDVLNGGGGNDRLEGGSGADIFRFEGDFGFDTITDLGRGDTIDLSAITGIDSFADLDISYAKHRAVITIGDNRIVLAGVTEDTLDAGDFLF